MICASTEEISEMKKLKKRLNNLREELEIVDPESELDSIFQNGQDDD